MKQAIHFMYDGVHSKDMGVFIAWNSKGLFEENFLPEREIIEKEIANREKPYFQGVKHKPLSFPLSFVVPEWDERTLRKIANWFYQPYYKPLIFDTDPNRVFYAMFEGSSELFHNGQEGYIELTVRCDSPYGYTHEAVKENIELRDSNTDTIIKLDSNNFSQGEFINTIDSSNGLTIDSSTSTWGGLYAIHKTWGDI